jgi:hypothetical protein
VSNQGFATPSGQDSIDTLLEAEREAAAVRAIVLPTRIANLSRWKCRVSSSGAESSQTATGQNSIRLLRAHFGR